MQMKPTHSLSPKKIWIYRHEARVADSAALARLLEPLPEHAELLPRLSSPFFARAWDSRTDRDHWISSDGARVLCLTVAGLTLSEAAQVRVRWDARRRHRTLEASVLAALVATEMGVQVSVL